MSKLASSVGGISKQLGGGGGGGNAGDMRGLTQYIADLRACRVRELEEKRINKEMAHIRQKFKDGNLDGYQKRKYLSKIVFTYILGYQVDIGHMEAVNLISSPRYSEKQIGYLALTLLMHENSDLVRLVVNSFRKDLDDMNETNNCLALHAIANIGGKEMADALAEDVHRLLISPTSRPFVKKKAALTLLRLYRKHPDAIPAQEWGLRIASILDDPDLGVALAVSSLVTAMAQDHPDAFSVCYQKAVMRMNSIVVDREYSSQYLYYQVPVPWLQVKLLRLLQYYPPSEDPTIRMLLHNVLQTILNTSQEKSSSTGSGAGVQHNNAINAVLFEAINLAIHIEPDSTIVDAAAVLLSRFIVSKETNVRYLGLDTMTHLASRSENLNVVKKHQDTVLLSLKDKDVSVRRRALDLLYCMCDTSNSKAIVGELLRYLPSAEYALREEIVLKIAILTEKFASEYEWYIDTILKLISQAGEHVGDEVWYRVIQIVTNTEQLQEYAAKKVFEHVKAPTAHESILKIGAYILGEYGHLVANEPGLVWRKDQALVTVLSKLMAVCGLFKQSPIEQFTTLHAKSNLCSPRTRALLLTTYFKWVNLFPEIKPQIMTVFDRYRFVLDAELQQRACEYWVIANKPTDDLLQVICDEMPPFPERESALIGRLIKKKGDGSDKRTWSVGNSEMRKKDSTGPSSETPPVPSAAVAAAGPSQAKNASTLDSLAGLDLSDQQQPRSEADLLGNGELVQSPEESTTKTLGAPSADSATRARAASASSGPIDFTHGADKWLHRLAYSEDGVLFEDAQIQIGVKSEYHGHLGRLALYFGNKLSATFSSFTVTVETPEPEALQVSLPQIPANMLSGHTQVQQIIQIECKEFFKQRPILRVSYLAGSHQTLTLRLPVFINKFVEPVTFSQTDFFDRWKQIGGAPLEAQKIFPIRLDASGAIETTRNKRLVSGFKLAVLEGIDPNPSNVVGAGVLHMSTGGKVGCLLRLEPNAQAKLCRLTIRTTNAEVSSALLDLLSGPLGKT